MIRLPVEAVEVGPRHRKTLGDLTELSESMSKLGLLHPIVVTKGNRLVAGQRRLEAAKQLGWTEVPAHRVDELADAVSSLQAESDENTCRLDMKVSEKVALGRELEELERPKAISRQALGRPSGPGTPSYRTRDVVGPAVGLSATSYRRAKTVVTQAETGNSLAQTALAEMDSSGKIRGAFDKVMRDRSVPAPKARENGHPKALTDRQRNVAHRSKQRIEKAVGNCSGLVRGTDALKVQEAARVSTAEEMDGWAQVFRDAISALKRLRKQIQEVSI